MQLDSNILASFQEGLKDKSLEEFGGERLRIVRQATSWGNCDTYFYDDPSGERIFLKTVHRHPKLLRWLCLRFFLRREGRIMKEVSSRCPEHMVKFLGLPSPDIMLQEALPGCICFKSRRHYTEETYPSLELCRSVYFYVQKLHELGIAHGDIRKTNILLNNRQEFFFIDWTTGCCLNVPGRKDSWIRKLYFRILKNVDDFAIQKFCYYYYPDEFQKPERHCWYLRVGHWYRRRIYHPFIKRISRRLMKL